MPARTRRRRLVALALVALPLTACRTPLWAERAEARLAAGDPAEAVAAYDRALAEHPSAGEAEALRGRRAEAAGVLGARTAGELAARGATPEAALHAYAALLLAVPGAVTAAGMQPHLDAAAGALLAEAEAELSRGRTYPAVRAAALVERTLALAEGAVSPELAPRAQAVLARARARHLELAAAADPLRAHLHRWLAALLGHAEPPPSSFPPLGLLAALDVELVRSGCPYVDRELLARRHPPRPGAAVRVRVEVDGCPQTEALAARVEPAVSALPMPRVEVGEERVFADPPPLPECAPGPCARFDELGVCADAQPLPPRCAEPRPRVAQLRPRSRVRWSAEPQSTPRTTWTRTLTTDVTGTLEVLAAGRATVRAPLAIHHVATEEARWSLAESAPFPRSAEAVRALAAEQVLAELDRLRESERAHLRAALGAELDAARLEPVRAERVEWLALRVATLGDARALEEELDRRHGVPASAVRTFLGLGAPVRYQPTLEAWRAPPVQLGPGKEWVREGPVPRGSKRGLAADDESGFALAYFARGSSLEGASRAHGLAFTARMASVHLLLAGLTPGLGGEVSGFRVALTGVGGDLRDAGFDLRFGLAYAHERAAGGARWRSLALPLEANLRLAGPLSATAALELNLLALGDLFDDDPGAPSHAWPVALGLRLDHGPWMLALSAAHDLGGPGGPVLYPSASCGVRL